MLSALSSRALSPATTGLLLFALTRGPASLREKLTQRLSPVALGRVITVLKALFAVGLIRRINRRLNDWALHQYRWRRSSTETWDWPKEIAVVSGGSSGIGAELVKKLAYKNLKVIVLDVNPLPPALTGCKCPDTRVASASCRRRSQLTAASTRRQHQVRSMRHFRPPRYP
jgi:all-trans-retinol dehydrogenase (NAD+)